MRFSELFFKSYRDDPADAEIASHKLLVRSGYLVKTGSGIYTFTPLMYRVLSKVMAIVSEEMDRAGAQQMLMPILQPLELWDESGRLDDYMKAGILFHLTDRKGGRYALGPTHEEIVTDLVRRTISSYKELPVILYQQQMKFRDEIRPRFGLMRGREFMMKDAYSFDVDEKGLDVSYEKMSQAYHRIFERIELKYVVVDADSGSIGGSGSQEFMVVADAGEDELLLCEELGYGANVEKADSVISPAPDGGPPQPLRKESTPGVTTVAQLCEFFEMTADQMMKTVLYTATFRDEETVVAVLMRGDRDVNEIKLTNHLEAIAVELLDDETVRRVTGAAPGFAGPVGLPEEVRVLADCSVDGLSNFLCGANETDFHCLDVNFERDLPMPETADLRQARHGDGCTLDPKKELRSVRGIEVGHIFKLGEKYSVAMDATFLGEDGKPHPIVMGCYGIGGSRIAQAAVEQNHDEDGIVWPWPIAPYHVTVTVAGKKDEDARIAAEELYSSLGDGGFEVLLDDRNLGLGARLKDAEIMGIPFRVLFGRGFKEGKVEIKCRKTGETEEIPPAEVPAWIESHK